MIEKNKPQEPAISAELVVRGRALFLLKATCIDELLGKGILISRNGFSIVSDGFPMLISRKRSFRRLDYGFRLYLSGRKKECDDFGGSLILPSPEEAQAAKEAFDALIAEFNAQST